MDEDKKAAITLFNKVFVYAARQMLSREMVEWIEADAIAIINSTKDLGPLDEALDWDIEEMINVLDLPE